MKNKQLANWCPSPETCRGSGANGDNDAAFGWSDLNEAPLWQSRQCASVALEYLK